ncbi:MAG: methylmalonyl Co-A mutase-associated GTPase MeaB [Syntrophomonadaceae bacterium]|nr:methylmalonyl Co-A mutase-associated GTPase MeaB [Syntrophomonadaceae bacterium]
MLKLAEGVKNGNRRALAQAISLVENNLAAKADLLQELFVHTGRAYVVGITGAPGAGKSSLVDKLTQVVRRQGKRVGIIAVDPTSPFSGGALLGDRIRMQDHVLDEGVFIRSMGSRGGLGGLSLATKEVVKLMDAAGFDLILVETVGVGQTELEIMHTADTTVVVLTPGLGDIIQTMKAGIMEIADVFAVNKADLDGAEKVIREVKTMLDFTRQRQWSPPVIPTVSVSGQGAPELWEAIEKHRRYLMETGSLEVLRKNRAEAEVLDLVAAGIKGLIKKEEVFYQATLNKVRKRSLPPDQAAALMIKQICKFIVKEDKEAADYD